MEAKNFFKAGAFAFAVLCAGSVNAQNNESINADSTKVEQQVSNQIKKGAKVTRRIKTIKKDAEGNDSVVFKNGATEVYADRIVPQMPDATLDAILDGSVKAYKSFNRNYDGQLRHRAYITALGGVVFDPDNVTPMAGLGVGYTTKHLDGCLSGSWIRAYMPAHSDTPGEPVNGVYFYFDGQWKAIRSSNGYWAFGPSLGIGYGVHQTNDLATGGSTNSGVTGRGGLFAEYRFADDFALSVQGGVLLKVKVDHAQEGTEWQQFSKNTIRPYVQIGLKWYPRFHKR